MILPLLLLAVFGGAVAQMKEPVVIDLEANPPRAGEMVTRLIKVDYSFETESVVYDDIENKATTPSVHLAGNFTFETLHYDIQGNVLARFKMTSCRLGPCDENLPPVFISFIQGGNNINSVFIDTKDGTISPEWNFLFSIVNTIYTPALNGEGDDQTVDTVYGRCRVQFGRPENKKFRRIIDGCDLGVKDNNYTRVDYADYVHYNQDVWYSQNTKIDADIVIIDAIEMLHLRTPFEDRWGFQLESRTHVEITNRSQYYVEKLCEGEVLADDCAVTELGLTKVGDKLYEGVLIGEKKKESNLLGLLSNYREHLFPMGDTHTCTEHSSLFAELFTAAKTATSADWNAAIHAPENEPILPVIANLLGSLGTTEALDIGKTVLFPQGSEFVDDFLFGLANAAKGDDKLHKQLMYWLAESKENEELYWKIANTLATVLRRKCEKTPSNINACQKGKDRIVNKFIDDLTSCEDDECKLKAIEVLQNLPLPKPYQIARGYLCGRHSPSIQSAALRLISAVPSHQYDSQLVQLLVRLFRDTCPQYTSSADSQMAVEILTRCVPDLQNAATLLLRGETNNPVDHEKWQYFYSAVEASGTKDELKEEFWKKMRQFKVFRPNYAQRSLIADSCESYQTLGEVGGFDLQQDARAHFDERIFRASSFQATAKRGKKRHPLVGVSVWTAGLDSYLKDGSDEHVEPSASARLSLLGHSLPVFNAFKGQVDLMAKVWVADGQTIKAFEGNVVLRSTEVTLPLLSGASVDFFSRAAASISLFGTCEISVWNRESTTDVKSNVSVALTTEANLVNGAKSERRVGSQWSAVTTTGANTEVAFEQHPLHVCMTMYREPVTLILDTWQTGEKTKSRKKRLPGVTFRQHDSATKQCNVHAKAHPNE